MCKICVQCQGLFRGDSDTCEKCKEVANKNLDNMISLVGAIDTLALLRQYNKLKK